MGRSCRLVHKSGFWSSHVNKTPLRGNLERVYFNLFKFHSERCKKRSNQQHAAHAWNVISGSLRPKESLRYFLQWLKYDNFQWNSRNVNNPDIFTRCSNFLKVTKKALNCRAKSKGQVHQLSDEGFRSKLWSCFSILNTYNAERLHCK